MTKFSAAVLFLSFSVGAQTVDFAPEASAPKRSQKEEILERIQNLAKAEKADFGKALNEIGEEVSAYARKRKKECSGEYSTFVIGEGGQTEKARNKLSKEEKKLCLLELIGLRKRFVRALYEIREKRLRRQHKEQLEHLEKMREESLKELEVMAGKLK